MRLMDGWTVKEIGESWYISKHHEKANRICQILMENRMGLEGLFSGDLSRSEFRTLLTYLHRVRLAMEKTVWFKASMVERERVGKLTKKIDAVLHGLSLESFFAADELRELMEIVGVEQ